MNKINRKIVIGVLAACLGLGGILTAAPSYAYGHFHPGFRPFHEFNHMYNSSLAVAGALAGLAIVGTIAATAAASEHHECVYYTHNCYEHHGERECYAEKHYGDC